MEKQTLKNIGATRSNDIDMSNTPLLKVEHLSLSFPQFLRGLKETQLQVISNFTLSIYQGQIMGVVGASGSGKSLLADSILGILPDRAIRGGNLYYKGKKLTKELQKKLRGKDIFLIPQSIKSLDPLMTVGKQLKGVATKKPITDKDIHILLEELDLPPETSALYPFELSGGMARRVLIGMALLSDASLVIADEPTPGLDIETRDTILQFIKNLAILHKKGILFITHDIEAALKIAHKITVLNSGKMVEIADVAQFYGRGENLKKEYTRALWQALPENGFHPPKTNQSSNH